jgi:hypothetical protein
MLHILEILFENKYIFLFLKIKLSIQNKYK